MDTAPAGDLEYGAAFDYGECLSAAFYVSTMQEQERESDEPRPCASPPCFMHEVRSDYSPYGVDVESESTPVEAPLAASTPNALRQR